MLARRSCEHVFDEAARGQRVTDRMRPVRCSLTHSVPSARASTVCGPEELQGKVSRECLVESLVDGILWNTDRRQTPIYRCSCGVSHPDDLAEGPSARSVQCAACGVTGDQAR